MATLTNTSVNGPGSRLPGIPEHERRRLQHVNWAHPGRAAERALILALSDERDRAAALADAAERRGYHRGLADGAGYCDHHHEDVADAFAAGQHAAGADARGGASAMQIGWNAAMDRFADAIGSRNGLAHPQPAHTRAWTRHHPACPLPHRGCPDLHGCRPGPREDFGKPAPWDLTGPELVARARASWAALGTKGAAA